MFTKPDSGRSRAFALPEVMVSTGLTSLLLLGLGSFSLYASRSCVSVSNYSEIESGSRMALDRLSQQVRQCKGLTSFSTNSLTLTDADGAALTFAYDANTKVLSRTKTNRTETILNDCDYLRFDAFQRTPISNSFEAYPASSPALCKCVQVTWVTSRDILGRKRNTDVVQSSKIVIRKRPS